MEQQGRRRFQEGQQQGPFQQGWGNQGWQGSNFNGYQQFGGACAGFGAQMAGSAVPNPFGDERTEAMQVMAAFRVILDFKHYMEQIAHHTASAWFQYGVPAAPVHGNSFNAFVVGPDYKERLRGDLANIDVNTLPVGLQELYHFVEKAVAKDNATEE